MTDQILFMLVTFFLLLANYNFDKPFIKSNESNPKIFNIVSEVLTLIFISYLSVYYPIIMLVVVIVCWVFISSNS